MPGSGLPPSFNKGVVVAPFPPPEVSWITQATAAEPWGMLANDHIGDSVEAAQLHMVEQWTFYSTGVLLHPTNQDAISLYKVQSGYVPGDPSTDVGTDLPTALQNWKDNGILIQGILHKINDFRLLNPLDETLLQASIANFGNVIASFQLPLSAQTQTNWTVPNQGPTGNGAPGSWGSFCCPIVARSPRTCTTIAWGSVLKMSHNFFTNYVDVDECYVVLSPDWLNSTTQLSPSGLTPGELVEDLASL